MEKPKTIFRKLKEGVINFFGNIRVFPLGLVVFGDTTSKLKGPDVREILNVLKPGDIVGNAHDNYVSSWFIKGKFSHVGLYIGDNKVIHVRTTGITQDDILTFLRADAAFVVRPKDQSIVPSALEKASSFLAEGIAYDYDFDKTDTSEFYCSEFTDCCTGYILRESTSKEKTYIYPDDYLVPSDKLEIILIKN